MDQERKEEIIKLYGEPFMQTKSGGVKLNKLCLSELFNASVVIRYIKPVGFFEEYLPTTKVWHKLDNDDDINHRIMTMIIAIVPEQIRMLVYPLLVPAVLSDIATLFRYKVGVDTLPLPPCPFIHLRDCLLVFDNTTKVFRSVQFSPDYNSRNMINRTYNPLAKCPRFLNELVLPMLKNKGDILLIQLYFGQCLLHKNLSQTFLIISGPAEIGKSALTNIIEKILGAENVTELHPERLSSPFELAEYAAKSLLTAKDVDNDALSANKINNLKKMTGNDLLAAEQKNKNKRLYMRGEFNIIITGNGDLALQLGNSRDAFKRRMIWIDCKKPENFRRISGFDDLLIEEEGDGILAWAIEGAHKLLAAGGIITKGEEQDRALEYLLGESEPIETFIKKCVSYAPDKSILTRDVVPAFLKFVNYVGWNNHAVINMSAKKIERDFCQAMLRLYPDCRHSTDIKVPGKTKMLRGYTHCTIDLPEDAD